MIHDDVITDLVLRDDGSPLQAAVDEYDRVTLEVQRAVADEATTAPFVWVYGPPASIDAVASSFEPEPTIASHKCLNSTDRDDHRLYRIEWADDRNVFSQLVEHNGTVLSATLDADGGEVQL